MAHAHARRLPGTKLTNWKLLTLWKRNTSKSKSENNKAKIGTTSSKRKASENGIIFRAGAELNIEKETKRLKLVQPKIEQYFGSKCKKICGWRGSLEWGETDQSWGWILMSEFHYSVEAFLIITFSFKYTSVWTGLHVKAIEIYYSDLNFLHPNSGHFCLVQDYLLSKLVEGNPPQHCQE